MMSRKLAPSLDPGGGCVTSVAAVVTVLVSTRILVAVNRLGVG